MPLTLNTKIYNGAGIINAVASYLERSGGIAAAFSRVQASLRFDSKIRGKVDLTLPEVATEATACACVGDVLRTSDAMIQFRIDPKAPLATREDLYNRLKDLVLNAEFKAMMVDLKNMSGA